MNVLLNIDETTPEFSVKVTSPFSVEIDFSPRRAAVGPTEPARKTYHFEATGHPSVERAFQSIEAAAAKRGAK